MEGLVLALVMGGFVCDTGNREDGEVLREATFAEMIMIMNRNVEEICHAVSQMKKQIILSNDRVSQIHTHLSEIEKNMTTINHHHSEQQAVIKTTDKKLESIVYDVESPKEAMGRMQSVFSTPQTMVTGPI